LNTEINACELQARLAMRMYPAPPVATEWLVARSDPTKPICRHNTGAKFTEAVLSWQTVVQPVAGSSTSTRPLSNAVPFSKTVGAAPSASRAFARVSCNSVGQYEPPGQATGSLLP
jgi:hypothetical protein